MKLQNPVLGGILIACLLLLAACDLGTTPTPTPGPPPSPTAVPGTPDPNLPVIVYEKTGGVAGTDVLVEIYADNTARLTVRGVPGTRVPLPANRVTDLLAQMDTIRFGDFADQYGVDRGVADDFFTTVILNQGGRAKTVKIAEIGGRGITPQPLMDLVQELSFVVGLLAAPDIPTAVPAPPTPATGSATAVPATPTPSALLTPDPIKPLIVYEKSGGIAGIHDVLEVYSNDTARWTPSRSPGVTFQLPLDTVEHLRTLLTEAHFFDLAAEYDQHNVSDDFYYTVTYTADGQTKQVTAAAIGGQDITPQALLDLITELQRVGGLGATVTPAPLTPTLVPPTPASATPLIVYEKSGGVAGSRAVLEIASDGAARLTQNRNGPITGQLSGERLAQLRVWFAANPFFDFAPEYDSHNVADDFYYTITYTAGGRTKTVKVAETGGQGLTPPSLLDLIGTLQAAATEVAGSGTPAPPSPTPGASGAEITYDLSGGLAGIREVLHISPTGDASATRNGQLRGTRILSPAQLATLAAQFQAAQFFTLQDVYDNGMVSDDRYMTITVTSGGQSKTVRVAEIGGQGLTPPGLLTLIATLQQIAGDVAAGPAPGGTPSATPGAGDDSPLIVYRMKGGIAGVDTSMTISRSGGARFTSRGADTGTAQLAADELQGLIDLFNQNNFFDLQDRYAPPFAPSDSETLTVTFNNRGRSKTVSVDSGATTPAGLDTILVRLLALQTRLQPK